MRPIQSGSKDHPGRLMSPFCPILLTQPAQDSDIQGQQHDDEQDEGHDDPDQWRPWPDLYHLTSTAH